MSKVLKGVEIIGVNFSDCKISSFCIIDSLLSFQSDAIYLDGQGFSEQPCKVFIRNWENSNVLRFDGLNESEVKIQSSGTLERICECEFNSDHAYLAGYEPVTGHWKSYRFSKPLVEIKIG